MNREAEILGAADYSEKIEYGQSSLVLIVNNRLKEHNCMFGFVVLKIFSRLRKRGLSCGFYPQAGL